MSFSLRGGACLAPHGGSPAVLARLRVPRPGRETSLAPVVRIQGRWQGSQRGGAGGGRGHERRVAGGARPSGHPYAGLGPYRWSPCITQASSNRTCLMVLLGPCLSLW